MRNKFTALFLFLVIANPLCCCFDLQAEELESTKSHSCCPSSDTEKSKTSEDCPSDSSSCGCDTIQQYAPEIAKNYVSPNFEITSLPVANNTSFINVSSSTANTITSSKAEKPSGREILQMNCVYRL